MHQFTICFEFKFGVKFGVYCAKKEEITTWN